ncbi:MAG: peptide-methionine (S)-S-oxide reductase MsrA [Pirellulaceae bacterium]|nr:peptide-methionine (S)-S-oxide reductase MsrA [Pirellulaceae bacterium]
MQCCNKTIWFLVIAFAGGMTMATSSAVNGFANPSGDLEQEENSAVTEPTGDLAVATFGGGCFWCVEAVFQELDGVTNVSSGYMGGHVKNPTYAAVCNGRTGHAEVVQITYDPEKVSFQKLLEVFFATHDPTTLNRQGNDVGTQYRSAVFFHDDEQKKVATTIKQKLNESRAYADPVVTEISAASKYYEAENYHQDYFALNPKQAYCRAIIRPKMRKFRKVFKEDLKPEK